MWSIYVGSKMIVQFQTLSGALSWIAENMGQLMETTEITLKYKR